MGFEKRYCVVHYFASGIPCKILEAFDTRLSADYAIFVLAKSHNVLEGDYIGISEQWQVLPDKAKAPSPPASPPNCVPGV